MIGKNVVLLCALATVGFSSLAYSQMQSFGTGFVAPQVNGKANVSNPVAGELVLDTSDNIFYGRDGASNWVGLNAAPGSYVPSGSILPFAGTTAPSGFILCDGSAVSRTTYAGLFATIGTAYGAGNGTTTFNVPDFRGRFLRGVDGGAGRDPDKASRTAMSSGGNTGDAVGSVQGDAFQVHTHSLSGQAYGYGGSNFNSGGNAVYLSPVAQAVGNPNSGNSSTETRPLNANVNYIIKY